MTDFPENPEDYEEFARLERKREERRYFMLWLFGLSLILLLAFLGLVLLFALRVL